jgi:Na+-transporting NADH:ubiquinone oxidoreductase subunit NqrB
MNALSSLAAHGVVPSREESLAPEPSTSGTPIEERSGQAERRDRSSRIRREPRGGAFGQTPSRQPPPRLDPRWYQIAMLSALLSYGTWLGFGASVPFTATIIGAALATQWICSRLWRLPRFDPLSALISGIGLATLLRTNGVPLAVLAAVLAIASKFVVRWRGKHLYNPTNLALAVMLLLGWGWISPGQYGQVAFAAMLIACLGLLVVTRAARADVTLSFLGVYGAILFGRSLWLGEPLTIPVHRLESGLLLQFAFNMISDPKTTPDSRAGRILFGALIALGAGFIQFRLFRTNGPVWSLAVFTPLVPLIDRVLPGARYQWNPLPPPAHSPAKSPILQGVTP